VMFGALASAPLWVGRGAQPALPKASRGPCVESVEFMRARHMELLDRWRNAVVRGGERKYVSTDGRSHRMSLTGTCLGCHGDANQFCIECHKASAVEITCFDCHKQKRSTP
jgi:hypothetical protein